MSCVFSTNIPTAISCDQPELTVSFPTVGPTPNTVVLANGAVVDLNQLGAIIARVCPAIACQPSVVMQSAATAGIQTVQTAPVLQTAQILPAIETLPLNLTQTATSVLPTSIAQVQQTINPLQMAVLGQMMGQAMAATAFRNTFDLWDG